MRPLGLATRRFLIVPQGRQLRLPKFLVKTSTIQTRSATYVLPDKTYPADMGKDKASYLLKTPKGTKDCTYTLAGMFRI